MQSKQFRNNSTGEIVRVIDTFENVAILENKQKIDVRKLTDSNYFTEYIDPNSFFNERPAYTQLAESIKTIPTEGMSDNINYAPTVSMGETPVMPSGGDEGIVSYSSLDDEKAELARKYGVIETNVNAVAKQNEAFSKILGDEEDLPPIPQPMQYNVVDDSVQRVEVKRDEVGEVIQRPIAKPEDPIHTMFRNAKKVVEFNLDLTLNNKIPRLDFIEMMEDSYEKSIIDFLSTEITNDLLKNPDNLKFQISEKIKEMVYGKPVKRVVKKTTTKTTPKTTQPEKKSRVSRKKIEE